MTAWEPSLWLLALALAVTLAAVGGAASGAWRRDAPRHFLGWAHALAAGLMLGLAYLLSAVSAGRPPLLVALGSMVGVVGVFVAHRLLEVGEMDRFEGSPRQDHGAGALIAASALHDTAEGVALGCALAVDTRLGIAAGCALALHNIAEAGSLAAVLAGLGTAPRRAFRNTVLANLPTPLVAPLVWWAADHGPSAILFPLLVGVAVGSLIYLVLVDLLPEAYERSGHASIALLVSAGLGLVVALGGWLG